MCHYSGSSCAPLDDAVSRPALLRESAQNTPGKAETLHSWSLLFVFVCSGFKLQVKWPLLASFPASARPISGKQSAAPQGHAQIQRKHTVTRVCNITSFVYSLMCSFNSVSLIFYQIHLMLGCVTQIF